MKNLLLFVILLLGVQTYFSQTKVDEYDKLDSGLESTRILSYLENLKKQDDSQGLIVVYSGEDESGVNSALNHIDGIKRYLNNFKLIAPERISFQIIAGKTPLFKEFWIYGKNEKLPEIKPETLNLDNLSANYLFASICAACDPIDRTLSRDYVSFALYAELLNRYPEYHGEIVINPLAYSGWNSFDGLHDAQQIAAEYRNILVVEYKISDARIKITIAKPVGKDILTTANFYIAPPSSIKLPPIPKRQTKRRRRS